MRLLKIFALVLIVSCTPDNQQPSEPEQIQEEAATMKGQSFLLTYYPVDESNPASTAVASRFNLLNYRITFETDSTYLQRSNKYLNEYGYRVATDSIYLNNRPYSMSETVDGLLLRDSLFKIELTPLR